MTIEDFHYACHIILENRGAKALNYCVPYARAGLRMSSSYEISYQIPYILSNMVYWRGPLAKKVRKILKNWRAH